VVRARTLRPRDPHPGLLTGRLWQALGLGTAIAFAVALVTLGVSIAGTGRDSATRRAGPEGVVLQGGPALAPAASPAPGRSVDGIACGAGEALTYHVHAYLAVFVRGAPRSIPLGIGIGPPLQVVATDGGRFAAGGRCFSYLHTHASDGIVHVEAATVSHFTLGQFFDVWGQRLDRGHVGPATGRVTAFVGGRRFSGDPRRIALAPHARIQLDVGRPAIAPQRVSFPAGL
jgi:hypothetical protein